MTVGHGGGVGGTDLASRTAWWFNIDALISNQSYDLRACQQKAMIITPFLVPHQTTDRVPRLHDLLRIEGQIDDQTGPSGLFSSTITEGARVWDAHHPLHHPDSKLLAYLLLPRCSRAFQQEEAAFCSRSEFHRRPEPASLRTLSWRLQLTNHRLNCTVDYKPHRPALTCRNPISPSSLLHTYLITSYPP